MLGVVGNGMRAAGVCVIPCWCWSLLGKGSLGTIDAPSPSLGIRLSVSYGRSSAFCKDLRTEKEAALPTVFTGGN